MNRILWALPLLLSACSNPSAPTRSLGVEPHALHATTFDSAELGCATVTNTTSQPHTYTLVVWDATDETNQRDVAHLTLTVQPGETAPLTVGLDVNPCARYQRDVYLDLPRAERYTLSDVGNYFLASPGAFWGPACACRNPPDPPVQPPLDGCPGVSVRPFDAFTATSVKFDTSGVPMRFTLLAGGVVFDAATSSAAVVTLRAPGGYYHQTFTCAENSAVVALVGNGR